MVGWNALLLLAGLTLLGAAGEIYLRLSAPFTASSLRTTFVPEVGNMFEPHALVRHTNQLDFWTTTRVNSLGFLDREPPSPARAAASCHVAVIGDSLVQAVQVPVADKLTSRLEALAARALPDLDVTVAGFGIAGTGQAQQLALYDEFARPLRPKLLVLVFVPNDFADNHPVLLGMRRGRDPQHLSESSVQRGADGTLALWPPDPAYKEFRLPPQPASFESLVDRIRDWMGRTSRLAGWVLAKWSYLFPAPVDSELVWRFEALRGRPGYAELFGGWRPTTGGAMTDMFGREDLPLVFEEALANTAFALAEFERRAQRDGAELVILATHRLTLNRPPLMLERLRALAAALEIPVIDHAAYIQRQGGELREAQWPHDSHWSPAGHQWAAEALLEYLAAQGCGGQGGGDRG